MFDPKLQHNYRFYANYILIVFYRFSRTTIKASKRHLLDSSEIAREGRPLFDYDPASVAWPVNKQIEEGVPKSIVIVNACVRALTALAGVHHGACMYVCMCIYRFIDVRWLTRMPTNEWSVAEQVKSQGN